MKPEEAVQAAINRGEIELYGEDAEIYDLMFSSDISIHNKAGSVRRNIPSGSKILDAGCGTGSIAQELGRDYDVYGVDISRDMLDLARDKRSLSVAQADLRALPFQKEFNGVVMHGHPVSHLGNLLEVEKALDSAYSALNDNGVLVMDYLTEEIGNVSSMGETEVETGDYVLRMSPGFSNYNPATHEADATINFTVEHEGEIHSLDYSSRVRGFTFEQMQYLLEEAGFETVEQQKFYDSDIQAGIRAEKGELERGQELGFNL